jgi:hypothetical protein
METVGTAFTFALDRRRCKGVATMAGSEIR